MLVVLYNPCLLRSRLAFRVCWLRATWKCHRKYQHADLHAHQFAPDSAFAPKRVNFKEFPSQRNQSFGWLRWFRLKA